MCRDLSRAKKIVQSKSRLIETRKPWLTAAIEEGKMEMVEGVGRGRAANASGSSEPTVSDAEVAR
jgi:hypothetical protein